MKVIKRNGEIVDYNRQKIVNAIEKANKEVEGSEKASKLDIEEIITGIESLGVDSLGVEYIQDII